MSGRDIGLKDVPAGPHGTLCVLEHQTLAIVSAMHGSHHAGTTYVHLSFGRVIDRLAARAARTLLCIPIDFGPPPESRDYALSAPNIELIPQPFYATTLAALPHLVPVCRSYAQVCHRADRIFVRGMIPFVACFYALAARYRRRPCHWIVGNPLALLRSHRRAGFVKDGASYLYAWQDRIFTRIGRRLTGGALLCNGAELGQMFRSPRTLVTVSSTVSENEFFERTDTCQAPVVRILFIGIIRPEKGLQYLIEALPRVTSSVPVELLVVGATDHFHGYAAELRTLAERLGVADRVRWLGYRTYGPAMFAELRAADMLVLPTLSEGTPRVLVEARANSLPIIATRVGGIPTSVTDGHDGLLVPAKNPAALAAAIDRIITDGDLRRALIRNGLATARRLTVDRFVDTVVRVLEES